MNGAEVIRDASVRRASPDRAGAAVQLRAGANRVLVKVCADDRGLSFLARFTRPDGSALADLAVDPAPAAAPVIAVPPERPRPAEQGVLAALRAAAREGAPAGAGGATPARCPHRRRRRDGPAGAGPRRARGARAAHGVALAAARGAHQRPQPAGLALQRAYALAPTDAHVLAALGRERG